MSMITDLLLNAKIYEKGKVEICIEDVSLEKVSENLLTVFQ